MEGFMTQAVLKSISDLTQFISDVRRIAAKTPDDREKLTTLRPLMQRRVRG
jgi:hypothetical protein